MSVTITATCEKCDTSESFTDPVLVNPWFAAHRCPVDLPETPTLGWVGHEQSYFDGELGVYYKNGDSLHRGEGAAWLSPELVTAFTPATAVPTDALDMLRADRDCSGPLGCLRGHVDAFLQAVDRANGDRS